MDYLLYTLVCGIGATAVMDVWGIMRCIAAPDYGLVGRWLANMTRGQFRHKSITAAPVVRGERLIGWIAHFLIGIVFAGMLIGFEGLAWIQQPTIGPALIVGIGTVAAPFLLMQPGMGAGLASSLTPRPGYARFQSLITHAVFGFGLYLSAWVAYFLYTI